MDRLLYYTCPQYHINSYVTLYLTASRRSAKGVLSVFKVSTLTPGQLWRLKEGSGVVMTTGKSAAYTAAEESQNQTNCPTTSKSSTENKLSSNANIDSGTEVVSEGKLKVKFGEKHSQDNLSCESEELSGAPSPKKRKKHK